MNEPSGITASPPPIPIFEPVVGAEEVAVMLGCSAKTVLRLAKARQIPAVQIASMWRFRKSAIDAWLTAKLHSAGRPRVEEAS